jgi:hypothetical protein
VARIRIYLTAFGDIASCNLIGTSVPMRLHGMIPQKAVSFILYTVITCNLRDLSLPPCPFQLWALLSFSYLLNNWTEVQVNHSLLYSAEV